MKPLRIFWYAAIVLLVLFTVELPAFAEEHQAATASPPKKYVEFTIDGAFPEVKTSSAFGTSSSNTLRSLFKKLEALKNDDEVIGVIFKIKSLGVGWAKLQEIQDKVSEFRATGKKTISYLEGGGNAEYALACAMDSIILMPTGSLNLIGLRAEVLFFKGLLEKVDIQAEMLAMGKYKSGIEPYTRDSMSEEFRESMTGILDEFYEEFRSMIADGRNEISMEAVASLIDQGPFTAKEAYDAKLVDGLQYYDELLESIKTDSDEEIEIVKPGSNKRKMPNMNSFAGLMQLFAMLSPPQRAQAQKPEQQLALIYASGPIMTGADDFFSTAAVITPRTLKKAFEKARTDETVHAVVLRVDSPGGSARASDLIWREVFQTQNEKPVVVSMSDVAASGGYYIAMAAGTIVAQPGTLTGSIGVFGGKLNLKGLYNKVGLTKEIITLGKSATLYSDYGGFTPTERERVEKLMQTVYQDFVRKAANGRKKPYAELDAIAQGRVWTGKQAKELGLVDELGGLETALAIAKKQAGFSEEDKLNIIVLPKQKTFFEQLFESMVENTEIQITVPLQVTPHQLLPLPALGVQWHQIALMLNLFKNEQVVTMLPFDVLIR